jgi:hypothetical protein
MKVQDMTQRYRKFKRTWGMWYPFDTVTGNSVSLKTRVRTEAVQKVNAMDEIERQPGISLGLAKVYLNATDPKLATRTWQEVMEHNPTGSPLSMLKRKILFVCRDSRARLNGTHWLTIHSMKAWSHSVSGCWTN